MRTSLVTSGAPVEQVHVAAARRWAVLVVCVASLCCGTTPTDPSPSVSGTDSLIAALQAAGASVVRAGVLPQDSNPFFSVATTRLTVDGHSVHVWDYPTAAEARAQAALISPGGYEIGNAIVDWIAPPHFYRGARIIVLYVGSEESLLSLLQDVLGPQFAGSD